VNEQSGRAGLRPPLHSGSCRSPLRGRYVTAMRLGDLGEGPAKSALSPPPMFPCQQPSATRRQPPGELRSVAPSQNEQLGAPPTLNFEASYCASMGKNGADGYFRVPASESPQRVPSGANSISSAPEAKPFGGPGGPTAGTVAEPGFHDTPRDRARAREQDRSGREWLSERSRRRGSLTSGIIEREF
jgi:hypothetical protein